MARPARWTAAALAATLTATLAVAAPAAAVARPPTGPWSATADTTSRVTLITGDVVEVAPAPPGRYAASVQPGPGRESVTFHTTETDDGVLLLPSDAVPYVSTGLLDPRLFDLRGLVEQGYGDASADRLPLIVHHDEARAPLSALADAGPVTELDSIDATALAPDKSELDELWRTLTGAGGPDARVAADPQFGGGIEQIWLDGKVTPVLDRSVGQVNAPAAWAAGYDGSGATIAVLDTGIDAGHPDLAGKIKAAENFSDSSTLDDLVGHGTHVASTALGTGAASGGARSGVASGADLLVGKVLNDGGSGAESWIIAGMEWATAQGADVVNLSLGGGATDGTDPLSQAVNQLSAETGALFVIAAGNQGADYSVGTPGTATAALTVGAVDRDDSLAPFSSRGPRRGDNAPKPEITAPGVGIVAARAAGGWMGTPVGEHYTAASGTSMATPHVAGAAALLVQAHPEWDGAQLKDALVSTAQLHPDQSVFAQGGGRLDAGRAVIQGVYATGILNFGLNRRSGKPTPPVDAAVSYTNTTGAELTLDLAVELTNLDRSVPATDALTLDATQVTVPAGATVDVPVALDVAALARGRHGGAITASGPDGVVARTTVATTLTGPQHRVTIRARYPDGSPAGADMFALHGEDPRNDLIWWIPEGQERTFTLEEGTYLLQALVPDFNPQFAQVTLITDPELEITGDMEIVLDAGTATPVRIETPRPSEQQSVFSYYVHREMGNGRKVSHGVMHFSTVQQLNVTPTEPLTTGEYEFSSRWQLVAPMVTAKVPGLHGPFDINLLHQSPAFEGRRRLPMVSAGTGTPEELATAGVTGAVALMTGVEDRSEQEQIAAAAKAGAAVALIVRAPDFPAWTVWRPVGDREPIPAMVVSHDDGQRLIEYAEGKRKPRISLTVTVSSPYLYEVMHVETDRVPDRIVHRVNGGNTARLDVRYTDTGGFEWAKEQRFGWRPWQEFAWNDAQRMIRAGTARQEWVSSGDTLWQHRVQHRYTWNDMGPLLGGMTEAPHSYARGNAGTVNWFAPVVRPAMPAGVPGLVSARTGDTLAFRVPEFVDAASGHYEPAERFEDEVEARLLRDGELVAELPDAWQDVPTTAEPASYRLELATRRSSDDWQWATRTETAWEFRSARPESDEPEPLPLLQVDYDVPADLAGRVEGDRTHTLTLSLRHQDGLAAPEGAAVEVEVSFDEGESWQPVQVRKVDDRFRVSVPPGKDTVSLRVHAQDASGSAVSQTVIRAYGLR